MVKRDCQRPGQGEALTRFCRQPFREKGWASAGATFGKFYRRRESKLFAGIRFIKRLCLPRLKDQAVSELEK
jgi:hypothetical protein